MSDTTTPVTADGSAEAIIGVLVELMRTATRPDVLEAQRVILQRLAHQGDVFPSRVPAPRNITELGGYLNLLEGAGLLDVRAGAVASALGVAGPATSSAGLSGALPVGFVEMANDRPPGPAQPFIPPTLTVRADFHSPLLVALNTLHAAGCQLPLRAPRPRLLDGQPGATATGIELDAVLAAAGRSMEVFPGTVLVDPGVDPLAIARPETPATATMRLVARELDGGTLVPEASWVARRASSASVADDPPAPHRYLEVAPVLQAAGWGHPAPVTPPTSLNDRGTLVRFVNLTGLVAGETTLGAELELLFHPAAIARSAFATVLPFLWNGQTFATP